VQFQIKYLAIGAVNTLIGLLIYPLVYWLFVPENLDYLGALIISNLLSVLIAYLNMKKRVFRTSGDWAGELTRFASFHGIVFLVNLVSLPLLVENLGLFPIIAQTIFSIFIIVAGYFWHTRISFKNYEKN